jgi:bacterioferritin B
MSKEINAALNEQIGHEFMASLQYVSIATYFDMDGLPAFARHFYRQAVEERDHAMRFVKFVVDAGGRVEIPAIPPTRSKFSSAEEAVKLSLEQELQVTQQINELVDLAIKQNNHVTKNFLDWFVGEQLEEVSSMDTLLRMIRRAGDKGILFVESYLHGNQPANLEADGGE